MCDQDHLAGRQLQALADVARSAQEQVTQLITDSTEQARAIAKKTQDILVELEQRGQLTEPIRLLILDHTQSALALLVAQMGVACDAIVQVVSRYPSASEV